MKNKYLIQYKVFGYWFKFYMIHSSIYDALELAKDRVKSNSFVNFSVCITYICEV